MIVYLYIKQHSITGLKYFGKTVARDPFKYGGSGSYWTNHCNKHGKEHVKTVEIWGFDDQELCTEFALKFSEENNIVESKEWANLIEENGLTGLQPGHIKSPETCRKLSEWRKGRDPWNKGLVGVQEAWNKGLILSQEYKDKISAGTKDAMSKIDSKRKQEYYEKRDSCNNRRWMNKDGKLKRVKQEHIENFKDLGWVEGRCDLKHGKNNGKFIKGPNINGD